MRNKTMPVAAEIHAKVTNVLVEVLAVDKQDVTPTAALQRDLGADSLDLLEIIFRLEHEFGIEIPRGELFSDSSFRINPEWVKDGKLTDKGLAEVRARLPYADLGGLRLVRPRCAVRDLFTVGLVGAYVGWKLSRAAGCDKEACQTNKSTRKSERPKSTKKADGPLPSFEGVSGKPPTAT
jgi:acyl carrier protein